MSKQFRGSLLPVCLLAATAAACGAIQSDFTDAGGDDDVVDGAPGVDGNSSVDATSDIDGQQPAIDAGIDAQPIDAPPITYQLDIRIDGGGTGTVAGGAINCPGTCSATYNAGASVSLTATPTGGSSFAGWNGACSGTGGCTVTMSQARSVYATFNAPPIAPNLMFVTSTTHTGNLGGLAGADAICQARAGAAGLAGTYRAWLSTTSVNANTRFGTASGWTRVDGKPFANTIADLGAGKIFYPPAINEFGVNVGEQVAMTNTTIGGGVHPSSGGDCLGFTSNAAGVGGTGGGYTSASSYMFENYTYPNCQTGARLYCFGVDRAATVSAPPVANARKAFERIWTPGGGIAGADAACQADATAAGLSGTYRALLATSGASALSRFNLAGAPWVRVDNAVILPTAQAWSTATVLDTGANVSANGQTSYGNYMHWTGAASMTAAGTAASTCNNWTDTAMTAMRGSTGTVSLSFLWTANAYACSFGSAVITCLQQ
jgi:hypothetical protein